MNPELRKVIRQQGATDQGASIASIKAVFPDLTSRVISKWLLRSLPHTAKWKAHGALTHYFPTPEAAKAYALADPFCRVNFHRAEGGATILLGKRQLVLNDLQVEKLAMVLGARGKAI